MPANSLKTARLGYATPKYRCSSNISLAARVEEESSFKKVPSAEWPSGGEEDEDEALKTAPHCRTASPTSSALVMAEITAMLSAPASNTCFVIHHDTSRSTVLHESVRA